MLEDDFILCGKKVVILFGGDLKFQDDSLGTIIVYRARRAKKKPNSNFIHKTGGYCVDITKHIFISSLIVNPSPPPKITLWIILNTILFMVHPNGQCII